MRRYSAFLSSSPARIMTILVASPICFQNKMDFVRADEWAHLSLLCLRCHDKQLSGRMYDLDFANDSRSIRCHKEASQVVDNELVPT